MRNYVIIGGGVAGVAAIETIRTKDQRGNITWICDDQNGYYSRPGLAFLLTGEINESQLYPLPVSHFKNLNVKSLIGQVVRIDAKQHYVVLSDRKILNYDQLLIATGAAALLPNVPGIGLEGVVKLDHLQDAKMIAKLFNKACNGIVIGGGITALEIIEAMVKHGLHTRLFLRGNRFWSNILNEYESQIIQRRLQGDGIILSTHTEIAEIHGQRGRVVGVVTKDGRRFKSDLIAVAIGTRPRVTLAKQAMIQIDRGILVNEHMQTSTPDIYAAGDVAQVFDPQSGKSILESLWTPAREQGTIAGLNMVGTAAKYRQIIPHNVTRLTGLTTTIIGMVGNTKDKENWCLAHGDSETWHQLPDAIMVQSGFDVNHLRLTIGENTLHGAVLMGDQTLSKPLQELITQQADITHLRPHLLQTHAPIADVIINFWKCWRENANRS